MKSRNGKAMKTVYLLRSSSTNKPMPRQGGIGAMPCSLARVLEFLAPNFRSSLRVPAKPEVTNEVSEYEECLLVRLRRGSVMQVRLQPGGVSVLTRIVPIAKAMQLDSGVTWQIASDSQLLDWIESDSAVWQWLLAKGFHAGEVRRVESALALRALPRRPSVFALRSKSSSSLP